MYKVGETVFYPIHGVGVIQTIEEKNILQQKRQYYIMKLLHNNMTMMIPVEMSEKLGLRGMTDESEIIQGLSFLESKVENLEDNWKLRYSMHQDKIKSGSFLDLSEVVRNLFIRNHVKELSNSEKNLFENALKLMVDEISVCYHLDRIEAEYMITEKLEKGLNKNLCSN